MPQDRIDDRKAGRTAVLRVALGAALAALVVCANTAVARAGDGDAEESFTNKFMRTLGLKNPGSSDYGISYSERSPLVVPPTRDLPPPVAAGTPPTPNWPKDTDIKRRAEAKTAEKVAPHVDWALESDRPLRPDELNPPGAAKAASPAGNSQQAQSNPTDPPPKKSIFSLGWFNKEEYVPFTGEPGRASLTDPPPGYQTPSPDQPYGIGSEKKSYKPPTVGERMEPTR